MNPWYKTTLALDGITFKVPHDVFSTQRIDEGTLLLLDHLPANHPKTILDMGCGYGALGLPVAKKYSESKVEMVDRDLLAAKWSALNALENSLQNVEAYGSLGFSNVKQSQYDLILCNVPARIGRPFIQNFFAEGNAHLTQNGEIRVVVIHDLCPIIDAIKSELNWPIQEIAKGNKHTIYGASKFKPDQKIDPLSDQQLYLRDAVMIQDQNTNLEFLRPFDLGGDDPKRLTSGLPVLFDSLPRQFEGPKKVLCFRLGYGQIPLVAASRWKQAEITCTDRDLLGLHFTKLNAQKFGIDEHLKIIASPQVSEALTDSSRYNLILGELSSSAGEAVAFDEIKTAHAHLAQGGEALFLCLCRLEKDIMKTFAPKQNFRIQKVLTRSDYTVIRIN